MNKCLNCGEIISEEIKEQIKTDINNWFKENFPNCIIPRRSLKEVVRMIAHEIMHYKITLKFIENAETRMELTFFVAKNRLGFGYNAKCINRYPWHYSLPQYYPKYIFVRFVHYLYDMIYNIFSFRGLVHLMLYTKNFIKTLFKFKVKVRKR